MQRPILWVGLFALITGAYCAMRGVLQIITGFVADGYKA